jgi:hypothetical protein
MEPDMKTEEDEAFDELAKRQGSWGGGFPAKRAMAADKVLDLDGHVVGKVRKPKREWVGLTDEETSGFTSQEMTVVKYVSKVLQEKNT